MRRFLSAYTFIVIFLAASWGLSKNTWAASFQTNSFAWSANTGWINFNPPTGATDVSDSQLSGFAWGENTGWITLQPTSTLGVHNDGGGRLSGLAWGEGLGFIDFSGVTINPATGIFSGTATIVRDGSLISFNCANTVSCDQANFNVTTAWRPYAPFISTPSPLVAVGNSFNPTKLIAPNILPITPIILSDNTKTTALVEQPLRPKNCPAVVTKTISWGGKNDPKEVKKLQQFLTIFNPAAGIQKTGLYNKKTYQEVVRLQKMFTQEIPVNKKTLGLVGPATRKKINKLSCEL